jgi:hypothetical protein
MRAIVCLKNNSLLLKGPGSKACVQTLLSKESSQELRRQDGLGMARAQFAASQPGTMSRAMSSSKLGRGRTTA